MSRRLCVLTASIYWLKSLVGRVEHKKSFNSVQTNRRFNICLSVHFKSHRITPIVVNEVSTRKTLDFIICLVSRMIRAIHHLISHYFKTLPIKTHSIQFEGCSAWFFTLLITVSLTGHHFLVALAQLIDSQPVKAHLCDFTLCKISAEAKYQLSGDVAMWYFN